MEVGKPKDRDFIETVEGLLFCVVGYLHPTDKYTAYLKYVPVESGKWSRGDTHYNRVVPFYHVSQIENTYDFLKENYPHYLFNCPVRNIVVSSVPIENVREYYRPKERFYTIVNKGAKDVLEQKLIDLIDFLRNVTGLNYSDFGVTGSILIGNHNPFFSDIDLTLNGLRVSNIIKDTMQGIWKRKGMLKQFNREQKKDWCSARLERFPLTYSDLKIIVERRWNYSFFGETYTSFHPIRLDKEIEETYGDLTYKPLGIIHGTARIRNSDEAMFLPATYQLENVETKNIGIDIRELISYEGMFCDVFKEDERVEFTGTLERVSGKKSYHRVVVGGSGFNDSYIKLL